MVPPYMTNGEIREVLLAIDRALTTNVNLGISPRVNVVDSTIQLH